MPQLQAQIKNFERCHQQKFRRQICLHFDFYRPRCEKDIYVFRYLQNIFKFAKIRSKSHEIWIHSLKRSENVNIPRNWFWRQIASILKMSEANQIMRNETLKCPISSVEWIFCIQKHIMTCKWYHGKIRHFEIFSLFL